jgi:hypothetical protein
VRLRSAVTMFFMAEFSSKVALSFND